MKKGAAELPGGQRTAVIAMRSRSTGRALQTAALAAAAAITMAGLLTACGPGGPASPAGAAAGRQAQAEKLVRQLLSWLVLPPGARPDHDPVPASLRHPSVFARGANTVAAYRLFSLAQPMAAVHSFLLAHVPAGMRVLIKGEGSGPTGITSQTVGYEPRSVPAGIHQAELVTTVVPGSGRDVLLRADAEVNWYPGRSAAEHLDPAGFARVTVSAVVLNPKLHRVRRTVTSAAVIARLARLLNALPTSSLGPHGCPMITATYRFAFLATDGRAHDTTVTTDGCLEDTITVGGAAQPPLGDPSARLLTAAEHLLHIHPQP